MRGRAFLDVARELASRNTEAHWRAAAGRVYYALMLEARDALIRWGIRVPPRVGFHFFVQSRFNVGSDPDVLQIGAALGRTAGLRGLADYDLMPLAEFRSDAEVQDAIAQAGHAISLLDTLDTDPAKRVAAVAAIRAVFGP
jgi:hypothetical protein